MRGKVHETEGRSVFVPKGEEEREEEKKEKG